MIVGLVGKKRAGKDTVAARLVEKHGFVRLAFADRLRTVMYELNPVIDNAGTRLAALVDAVGWEATKNLPEVRRLLQHHGVAIRTHVDPEVWVRPVMRTALAETRPIVITDVRFPNEADAIERAGGRLVRVVRTLQADGDKHVSETALDGRLIATTVINDGTLADLQREADRLAQTIAGHDSLPRQLSLF